MSETHTIKTNRLVWLLLLAGISILLFWAGMKAWRIYQASSSLMNRQSEVEQLLIEGPANMDAEEAEDLVFGLRADVRNLNNEVGFLLPVLPYLYWLPEIGPLASSAPQLMEMADAGTEAAAYAFRGVKPAFAVLEDDSDDSVRFPQMLQILETAKPDLARASLAMDRVVAAREEIENTDALPWRVRTLLAQADEWLPLGQAGLKLTLVMPQLMGLNEPRHYLIIAQNEDELRSTGGFFSGAGLVEVDKGRIVKLDFQDASSVDAWGDTWVLTKPYGDSPKAFSELMLLDLYLFRDANFWPDFSVSAEKAMDLYSYGQSIPPLDGAIAFDQHFIKLLMASLGPVLIPDTGEIINENNIVASLQDAWTLDEGIRNRKDFLPVFAQAIRGRIENELSSIDPVYLAQQMSTALHDKDLQIAMRDPLASTILAEVGWSGRLEPPNDHDALMVVDNNFGYNKANIHVQSDMAYHIRLSDDGTAQADLTINHIHNGEDNGEPCWQGTNQDYRDKASYRDLAEKCYYAYLRVYAPENSQLISGPQHIVPAETWLGGYDWDRPTEVLDELPGFTTFANFILLPRSSELTSQYEYELPSTIVKKDGDLQQYRLRLYKQAGTPDQPVQIAVTLPPGAQIDSVSPEPSRQDNGTIYFTIDLDSDQSITVNFNQE